MPSMLQKNYLYHLVAPTNQFGWCWNQTLACCVANKCFTHYNAANYKTTTMALVRKCPQNAIWERYARLLGLFLEAHNSKLSYVLSLSLSLSLFLSHITKEKTHTATHIPAHTHGAPRFWPFHQDYLLFFPIQRSFIKPSFSGGECLEWNSCGNILIRFNGSQKTSWTVFEKKFVCWNKIPPGDEKVWSVLKCFDLFSLMGTLREKTFASGVTSKLAWRSVVETLCH